jgi:hypothetical protein
MLMTFKGRGEKAGEIPVGMDEAKRYFVDLKAFILKIEDVREVKELGRPGAFLVYNHPVGALNFNVDVVWAIQVDPTETGMAIRALDFDLAKAKTANFALQSMVNGELVLTDRGLGQTGVDFWFSFAIETDIPGPLKLIPSGLIQSTADSIMNLRVAATVGNLYGKVQEDFKLAPA